MRLPRMTNSAMDCHWNAFSGRNNDLTLPSQPPYFIASCPSPHSSSSETRRRPAGLVAGAQAGAVVAVEELVERDMVAPGGSVWKTLLSPKTGRRPLAIVAEEQLRQAPGEVAGNRSRSPFRPEPVGQLNLKRRRNSGDIRASDWTIKKLIGTQIGPRQFELPP